MCRATNEITGWQSLDWYRRENKYFNRLDQSDAMKPIIHTDLFVVLHWQLQYFRGSKSLDLWDQTCFLVSCPAHGHLPVVRNSLVNKVEFFRLIAQNWYLPERDYQRVIETLQNYM